MLRLLGVGAAVVDVGVREAGVPHHHTAERGVALVLVDERGEGAGLEVVLGAALGAGGSQRGGRHADEELGVGRGGVGDVGLPVVVVDVGVDGAAGVVVELDPEVVELRVGDDHVHVRLGDGALRRAGDVVGVAGVGREVGAQLGDQVLVVLVAAVGLDVKVPAVDEGAAEGTRHAAVARVAVRIPEVLADGLGLFLRLQRVGARRAAQRQDHLDAVGLAGVDGLGQVVAVLALTGGGDVAGLTDRAGRDGVAVTPLVQEGQHDDVDAGAGGAVGGQVIVLDDAAAVLAPVYDVLSAGAGRIARHESVRECGGSGGHEADAGENLGEMHVDKDRYVLTVQ